MHAREGVESDKGVALWSKNAYAPARQIAVVVSVCKRGYMGCISTVKRIYRRTPLCNDIIVERTHVSIKPAGCRHESGTAGGLPPTLAGAVSPSTAGQADSTLHGRLLSDQRDWTGGCRGFMATSGGGQVPARGSCRRHSGGGRRRRRRRVLAVAERWR